jgi:CBS domain-containing protein
MTRIRDVMTLDIRSVTPASTILDAAKAMQEMDVGVLPVCDGPNVLGIVTDRDIVVRGIALGLTPEAPVEEVMTADVVTCAPEDDIEEVAEAMQDAQVRRIPVLDEASALVGMVTLGDLATRVDERLAGEALTQVSEPSAPARPLDDNAGDTNG